MSDPSGNTHRSRREPLLLDDDGGGDEPKQPQQPQQHCCSAAVRRFVLEAVWPGLGLLGESYMLFSLGLLRPVWERLFPDCYGSSDDNDADSCAGAGKHLALITVLGLIGGMAGGGGLAQLGGRRNGSIATALLMCCGGGGMLAVALLCASADAAAADGGGNNSSSIVQQQQRRLLRGLAASLFVLGLGVGGEYPLAAASAAERAMEDEEEQEQKRQGEEKELEEMDGIIKQQPPAPSHGGTAPDEDLQYYTPRQNNNPQQQPKHAARRGRRVQLVFSMQGAGIFLNSLLLTVLLWITAPHPQGDGDNGDDDDNDDYDAATLLAVWQITYAVGFLLLLTVLVTRVTHLRESAVWQEDRWRRQQQQQQEEQEQQQQNDGQETVSELDDDDGGDAHSSVAAGATARDRTTLDPQQQQQHNLASPISMVSSVSSLSAPSVVAVKEAEPDRPLQDVPENDDLLPEEDRHGTVCAGGKHGCCARLGRKACGATASERLRLLRRHYGARLLGCSACWFLWDVAFYGNKLFQSTFLLALTGRETTTLLELAAAATLNAGVALAGYVAAAFVLDGTGVGRRQLQQWGFFGTGALFVGVGFWLEELPTTALVAMYLGSSFFGQLGPNATTFLIPTEVFPTELRTVGHGLAAASGKAGALAASLLFTRYCEGDALDMFLLSGYASFLAGCVTYWTIPETAGLDLRENDVKWRLILAGRVAEYDGAANHPAHLSVHERHVLQRRQREAEGLRFWSSDLHELHG